LNSNFSTYDPNTHVFKIDCGVIFTVLRHEFPGVFNFFVFQGVEDLDCFAEGVELHTVLNFEVVNLLHVDQFQYLLTLLQILQQFARQDLILALDVAQPQQFAQEFHDLGVEPQVVRERMGHLRRGQPFGIDLQTLVLLL